MTLLIAPLTADPLMADPLLDPVPDPARLSRAERSRRTDALVHAARACDAAGDEAGRDVLLEQVMVINRRVADAVAARYRDRGVPLEDLQQAAYEGLVKAVRRFDTAQAEDLLTFAVPTIRGEVQRYFRDRSWMVRPPRRVQELQHHVNAAIGRLHERLGREPTDAEVCADLDLDPQEHAEVVTAFGCFHPASLDRPVGDDDGAATLGELLPDTGDERAAAEARCLLAPAVSRLGARDQRLVYLRFYEQRTQLEIATELGLTQTQVSRLLARVLRDLRQAVGAEAPVDHDVARPVTPLGRARLDAAPTGPRLEGVRSA
ncbi:sigma-70 family RNA polymerase sigma factor [Nocardioides litoris]|uniref:sigma-70 family RNA polymerase sigma factor n=1 Tax=Nocardioides litoris TaxID=1926648 RepID=UPI001FE82F42|nr:sigma-70 family RNA polymerase sigma factor [Nocardioides litoris]